VAGRGAARGGAEPSGAAVTEVRGSLFGPELGTRQGYVGSPTGTNLRSHSLELRSPYVLIGACEADMTLTMIRRQHNRGHRHLYRRLVNCCAPYWFWLRCDAYGHNVAVALVPFVIRWVLTRRPTCCAEMHGARRADDVGRACNIRAGLTRLWGGNRSLWQRQRACDRTHRT
jgi:hypothetical protein